MLSFLIKDIVSRQFRFFGNQIKYIDDIQGHIVEDSII